MRSLLGWATPDRLPAYFKLLSARIVEPHSLEGDPGSIYLWVEELDDGRIFSAIDVENVGRESGVAVTRPFWQVWTFRDGKPVEWTYFGEDRAAALEAVGLSEQDAHADS